MSKYVGSVHTCPAKGPSLSFHVDLKGVKGEALLRFKDDAGKWWEGRVPLKIVRFKCPECGQDNDSYEGHLCDACVEERES